MPFDQHYLFLVASVVTASFSQILLKKGAMIKYDSFWREYINPWVITGYGMMFVSLFFDDHGPARFELFECAGDGIAGLCTGSCFERGFLSGKNDAAQISGNRLHSSRNGNFLSLIRKAATIWRSHTSF